MFYVALVFITFLVAFTYFLKKSQNGLTVKHLPQQPGLPFLGNIFFFLDSPENLWSKIRKLSKDLYPIYKIQLILWESVNLISPDDIEVILSSSANIQKGKVYFPVRDWMGDGLLTSFGKKWQIRRKILTPAFHFNILKGFFQVFDKVTIQLVMDLEKECSKKWTDIVPIISQSTLKAISETAMGSLLNLESYNPKDYLKNVTKMGSISSYRILRPWLYPGIFFPLTKTYKVQKETLNNLHSFTTAVIEKKMENFELPKMSENNEDDEIYGRKKRLAMLDLLIKSLMENGDIDVNGIREEVDTFMFEGHDTTSVSICYTLMLLANHQEIQNKVREEIWEVMGTGEEPPTFQTIQKLSYMELVIKESLRLYPSVPFISRDLVEPVHMPSGYYLPANTEINIHIMDLHVNEKFWPDPYKFDPDRFLPENSKDRHPFAYLPFSAGPRNCIGQKFAMLELKTYLAGILRKFRLLPIDTPSTIRQKIDLVNRTTDGIKIKFERLSST